MFSEYLDKIRAEGRRYFTLQQAMEALGASSSSVKAAIFRLKKQGKIVSPARGLYIMVPPEYRKLGCIPPEELMPILARHKGFKYYSALLTAAKYYGAAHQKPAVFQIFVDRRLKKVLQFGQINIEWYYKSDLKNLPVRDVKVATGHLKISSPEVTARDIISHVAQSGGINNVATVLSELIESIDPDKLIAVAEITGTFSWLQRLGFMLERLDTMYNVHKEDVIAKISAYLSDKDVRYIPLLATEPLAESPRHHKWKIIENITFESDV